MKKIICKGYTVEVVSWENDGDNYNTQRMTVDTKEEALAIKHMCENLFISNYDNKTIGNKCEEEYEECYEICKNYLLNSDFYKELVDKTESTEKVYYSFVSDINSELFGGSEFYFARVCDSCTIYYSPEDIYLEEIK